MTASPENSFDALLLLSFGGPEKPEDLMDFLRNVVAGRNVPDERLAEVAEQYEQFGGVSPINEQNRRLIAALSAELSDRGIELPIYFGNRNWHPFVSDTVATMHDDGVRSMLVLVTSAFGSYSGCRQYQEDVAAAVAPYGSEALRWSKIRLFYNHPGFVDAMVDRVRTAYHSGDRLLFTAHSIPVSMAATCDYEQQLESIAALVAAEVDPDAPFEVVYQSRSGPPAMPWLEPDIGARLRYLAGTDTTGVTVVPLGFVSDHQEVRFDLDTLAASVASEVGIEFRRAHTVGTHPLFVAGLADLVAERLGLGPTKWCGEDGPWPVLCPADHCPAPMRAGSAS